MKTVKMLFAVFITLLAINANLKAEGTGVILNLNNFYDVLPDVANCKEGVLKESEKMKVLARVNQIRAIHGLKPVVYDANYDLKAQKSALISAATEQLDHEPPPSVKCYSQDGRIGAEHSNLHIQWYSGNTLPESEYTINSWMIDRNVVNVGHRRWIIDPFLKFIAFGRVDGSSAMGNNFKVTAASIYVISNEKQNISDWDGDFVAYPYQNYPTAMVFDKAQNKWHFSFTAIVDKNNYWNNMNVNWAQATIQITDEANQPVATTIVQRNNMGYGVPNCLIFDVPTAVKERRYNVSIKNVIYQGQSRDYSYWFKITDQPIGNLPAIATLLQPANNSLGVPTDVTLQWQAATDAESYRVEISENENFHFATRTFSSVTATSQLVEGLKGSTLYYWRVKSRNSVGESEYSPTWQFTTAAATPSIPAIFSPLADEQDFDPQGLFRWSRPQGATKYHLQISLSDLFYDTSLYVNDNNIQDTTYRAEPNKLPKNTMLFCRVAAGNQAGMSNFSPIVTFRTALQSSVEYAPEFNFAVSNYPNPFNNHTIIRLETTRNEKAKIEVYSALGEKVIDLFDGILLEGTHEIDLDMTNFAAGNYYLIVTTNDNNRIVRLLSNRK